MKIGVISAIILSIVAIVLCINLENKIKGGKISMNQIRIIRKGSVYIIDDIEGLGRNKHFISFKEE